jgi:DNA-binding transcriptional ArsR family regulator
VAARIGHIDPAATRPVNGDRPPMLTIADEIDAIQASVLRALASPHRLRIVHRLGAGPLEVTELARSLGMTQAATSQHLAAMRSAGIVEARRDGRSVRYELADPGFLAACGLMRDALVRRLSRFGDLAAAAGETATADAATVAGDVPATADPPPTGDEPARFAVSASKVGPS